MPPKANSWAVEDVQQHGSYLRSKVAAQITSLNHEEEVVYKTLVSLFPCVVSGHTCHWCQLISGCLIKQHCKGDGAVKCHGNKSWQLLKGRVPPSRCRFTAWMSGRRRGRAPRSLERFNLRAELQEVFRRRETAPVPRELTLDCSQLWHPVQMRY